MFLNYFALILILLMLVIIFYVFIYIHELPYEAAKHRNHPQQDAIYVACWLSLFTLHAIWPIIFIWALSHKDESHADESGGEIADSHAHPQTVDLNARLAQLDNRLRRLEERPTHSSNGPGVV
jgi:type VI protein secretion system component VasK